MLSMFQIEREIHLNCSAEEIERKLSTALPKLIHKLETVKGEDNVKNILKKVKDGMKV